MVDYYAVLGVNPGAEDIVIRAAYKALAQRYHPDRFSGPEGRSAPPDVRAHASLRGAC